MERRGDDVLEGVEIKVVASVVSGNPHHVVMDEGSGSRSY